MPQLLLVEDDAEVRTGLIRAMSQRGHAVDSVAKGMDALRTAIDSHPDVVLLDLGLPDVDGHALLRMLRAVKQTPVIVVTARDDDGEVIRALDAGADDYIVKPFGPDHLDARIRAVLRRSASPRAQPYVVGGLTVDVGTREVLLDGRRIDLSRREFDLLAALAARAGQVVTKRELQVDVWQQPYGGAEKTVEVHLSWLRRKLGETAQNPRYLHSVRGVGVKLVPPAS